MVYTKEKILSTLVFVTFLVINLLASSQSFPSKDDVLCDYTMMWNTCSKKNVQNQKICQDIKRNPIFEHSYYQIRALNSQWSNELLNNTDCRSVNSNKLHNQDGTNSLSPYVWKLNYRSDRFPRVVCEAVCLDKFCRNPANRTQRCSSLASVPTTYQLGELRVNTTIKSVKYTIGCTCAVPRIRSVS